MSAGQNVRLKVVLRNLPPQILVEDVKKSLVAFDGQYDFFYFVRGKKSSADEVPSLAYLHFKNFDGVLKLYSEYNGHAFVDTNGREYICAVEYAPYQKSPNPQQREDTKLYGTITEDPDYKAFEQSLQTGEVPKALGDDQVNNRLEAPKIVTTTPLIEMIKQNESRKQTGKKSKDPNSKRTRGGRSQKGGAAATVGGGGASGPNAPKTGEAKKKRVRTKKAKGQKPPKPNVLNITVTPGAAVSAQPAQPQGVGSPSNPSQGQKAGGGNPRQQNPNRNRGGGGGAGGGGNRGRNRQQRGGGGGGGGGDAGGAPSNWQPVQGTPIKIQSREQV